MKGTVQGFALFDFDGTLSPGDSIVPYLQLCIQSGVAPARQWIHAFLGYCAQRVNPKRTALSKEQTLSFIRGKSMELMDTVGEKFWNEYLMPRMYRDGLKVLQEMHDAGYIIWLISASPECYMHLATRFLPVDRVYATPCQHSEDGFYTGSIPYNCRGKEKVAVFREAVRNCGLEQVPVQFAFGDSQHDIPMLRLAEHAVLIRPKPRVRQMLPEAEVQNWQ